MDFGNLPAPRGISIHSPLTLICGQVDIKHVSAAEDECSIKFSVSFNLSIGLRIIDVLMGVDMLRKIFKP